MQNVSSVQVSALELRLYYDAIGPRGRYLCIAISRDGGITFTKPMLGIVDFGGSTANNIVLGSETEYIEPGIVFIDTNPKCLPGQTYKAVATWHGGATMFASVGALGGSTFFLVGVSTTDLRLTGGGVVCSR